MLGRLAIVVPLTIVGGLVGLFVGMQESAAVSWSAAAFAAAAALVIGPAAGSALVAVLPDVLDSEKWGPGDLFLPALGSSTAFAFVVPQAICSVL
jgi:hypothetical protein